MSKPIPTDSVLCSFSGESGAEIQTLYAVAPDGTVYENFLEQPSGGFDELRGIAFAPDGRLFIANAHKSSSAIYIYDRDLSYTGQSITPDNSSGLWHPYELVFSTDGSQVLASSQDTNVVTAFDATSPFNARPLASYLVESFGQQFYPGTRVASAVPQDHGGCTPTAVPAASGGLNYEDDSGGKHSVRGVARSRDGKTLFVADEPGNRLVAYDFASGAYLYEVTESKNHSLEAPVGVALNPVDGCIYVGSTGNRRIFKWDPQTQDMSVFAHHKHKLHKVSGITFNAAGTMFTASRDTCEIYQVARGSDDFQPLTKHSFKDEPECLAVYEY